MARRNAEEEDVSLFPFLSILACLIGTLVLMIMGLALSQMDTGAVAMAETYSQVNKQLKTLQQTVQELTGQVDQKENRAGSDQQRLKERREELEKLRDEIAAAIEANQQPIDVELPQLDREAHEKLIEQLQVELEKIQERIKELLAELAKRKKPPEEAEVQIRPSGSGVDLEPTFVECNAQGLVLYGENDEPYRVPTAAIKTDEKLLQTIKRVAGNKKASIVFLVRSDGLHTYNVASSWARENYARNGKLPVVGKGKIDLSLFRNTN